MWDGSRVPLFPLKNILQLLSTPRQEGRKVEATLGNTVTPWGCDIVQYREPLGSISSIAKQNKTTNRHASGSKLWRDSRLSRVTVVDCLRICGCLSTECKQTELAAISDCSRLL